MVKATPKAQIFGGKAAVTPPTRWGVVTVGLLYGAAVFAVNNFATAPFLSWVRSLYLHTPVLFKPPMGWTQLAIHLFCVGLPIALVMHIFASDKS